MHNTALQLKMGGGRFQSMAAERVRLRELRVTTLANGNFADRGRFGVLDSVSPLRVNFS